MPGQDPNVFAILGRAQKIARDAGLTREQINAFAEEATSDDYAKLVATVHRWFATT
jgi:hypothetical protein